MTPTCQRREPDPRLLFIHYVSVGKLIPRLLCTVPQYIERWENLSNYLVLFTMVPRNTIRQCWENDPKTTLLLSNLSKEPDPTVEQYYCCPHCQ